MMISLLADVTRHLAIATFIVHFISCCLPRLLGYYTTIETSLFLLYMLDSSITVSCVANSDGVDDVRGARRAILPTRRPSLGGLTPR
jgi:hypothetical protein